MKIEISLLTPSLHNQVIQALSDAQLLDKVELSILPDLSLAKPAPRHKLTMRTFHFVRQADNTFFCKENGQTIPSTNQGKIDMDQLIHERMHWIL